MRTPRAKQRKFQTLHATALAKVNLTLSILGRNEQNYHELLSLVAFARAGDHLTLTPVPDAPPRLTAEGPFAATLTTDQDAARTNLIIRAAEFAVQKRPDFVTGHFHLVKHLPVAAGLGGGSADAAAALRLIMRANGGDNGLTPHKTASGKLWDRLIYEALDTTPAELATALGADVPVCLNARPAFMTGIGEQVAPLDAFPELPVLLVNPGVAVSTGDIFKALAARPLPSGTATRPDHPSGFASLVDLLSYTRRHGNDLAPPAERLCPPIRPLLAAIHRSPGCRLARLSGSGASCYGLYETPAAADQAKARLAEQFPDYWLLATSLTGLPRPA